MASLALLGGVAPTTWDRFINPSFAWVFGTRGGAPERGFLPSLDEPVGRYPTVTTTPRNKTINPAKGVTAETPTTKNPPPRDGKGVMSIT